MGTDTCDGRFPASAFENSTNFLQLRRTSVSLYPLAHFIPPEQSVLLIKVDTEGNELGVLRGSLEFFKTKQVQNLIVEVTPCCKFWANHNVTQHDVASVLRDIADYGYSMVSLFDWSIHRTPDQVYKYILNARFKQSDMWLTRMNPPVLPT